MVAVGESKIKKVKPKTRREVEKGDTGDAVNNGKKKIKARIDVAVTPSKEFRRGDSVDTTSADERGVEASSYQASRATLAKNMWCFVRS
jgi:hypothetical protein